jgi:CheY-like chemotaxis protein
VRVHGDAVRLAQVFSNLLINACKYSDRGSRIDFITEMVGADEVAVRIRDHGIGIPPQQLGRVFEMFSQVEPSLHRAQGGLGIGLSLARGLIELHGGTISVHSGGERQGSEFVVRLPALPASAAESEPPPLESTPARPFAGRRVLGVADIVDAAVSMSDLLSADGATTAVANDGPSAIEAAESFRPDAVLVDIGLPGLNGYEVCAALRRRPWAPGLQIVALSGWGQPSDREKARQAGFDQHLVKPVDYPELTQALARPNRA